MNNLTQKESSLVAPGLGSLHLDEGARLFLVKRPCGEIRLLLREIRALSKGDDYSRGTRSGPFIYSVGFQDSLLDFCQPAPGFGRLASDTTFTKLAKSRVIDGCAVMSLEPGYKSVFATGTLPGSSQCAMRTIACMSAQIVEWMTNWIRDVAPKARYVYVWEWQKRGALHIHVAITDSDLRCLRIIERGWKEKWIMWLQRAGEIRGFSLFERGDLPGVAIPTSLVRANCRPAIKDLGRYMGKYLSKQCAATSGGRWYCPSRWWGMSKTVRADISRHRQCVATVATTMATAIAVMDLMVAQFAVRGATTFIVKNPYSRINETRLVYLPLEQQEKTFREASTYLSALAPLERGFSEWEIKPSGQEWW